MNEQCTHSPFRAWQYVLVNECYCFLHALFRMRICSEKMCLSSSFVTFPPFYWKDFSIMNIVRCFEGQTSWPFSETAARARLVWKDTGVIWWCVQTSCSYMSPSVLLPLSGISSQITEKIWLKMINNFFSEYWQSLTVSAYPRLQRVKVSGHIWRHQFLDGSHDALRCLTRSYRNYEPWPIEKGSRTCHMSHCDHVWSRYSVQFMCFYL